MTVSAWKAERNAEVAELCILAEGIAAEMGGRVEVENDADGDPLYPTIKLENGEGFYLTSVWNARNRVEIKGNYPVSGFKRYGESLPEITCAKSRGPATIAKEIARRFMLPYRDALAASVKYKTERDSYENARERAIDTVCASGLAARSTNGVGDIYTNLSAGFSSVGRDSIRFSYVNCKPETAVEILKLLKAEDNNS